MKSGDFVTKLVRNQTDAYPSSFAPRRFRSLQCSPTMYYFGHPTYVAIPLIFGPKITL